MIGKDNFLVTSHTKLCDKKFAKSDIICPPGETIKRVNGKNNFRVTSHNKLCEKIFAKTGIICPPGGTLWRLTKDAKPVLFESMLIQKKPNRCY